MNNEEYLELAMEHLEEVNTLVMTKEQKIIYSNVVSGLVNLQVLLEEEAESND